MARLFSVLLFAVLTSGVEAEAAQTRWPVSEQPDLKAQLEQAPPADVEEVAPGPRSVEAYGTIALVPNRDGRSYDALYLYFKSYTEDVWLYAFDLGTGTLHRSRFPDGFQIHLSGQSLAPDGKYYITTNTTGGGGDRAGGMNLFVYDPATNALENRGVIVKGLMGERRDLVYGPDGYLYGTGSYGDAKKAGAYRYDFRTGEVRDFGPVGPSHAPHGAWGYFLGVDDQYLYVASGKVPWYLVAVNLKTGEDRVIMERPAGDRSMWIIGRYPGAVLKAKSNGLLPANQFDQEYWLWHGEAIRKVDDNPPWPKSKPPLPTAGPEPEVYDRQMQPDADGKATLWYRLPADKPSTDHPSKSPEERGWRKIVVEDVPVYPLDVHRMALLPDGQIFVAAAGYNGRGLFNPATGEMKKVADGGGGSTYTYAVADDRLWFSGYSSGPVYVYDWRRPWTIGVPGAPGTRDVNETFERSNPRRVAMLMDHTRMKKVLSSAVAGDGLIFFGGLGQRDYAGGGFGWVDPKTLEAGGIWKPFSGYRTYWLTTVNGGSHLIASTKTSEDELNGGREPETARLFLVDARTKEIVRHFEPVKGAEMAGPVLEVAPGRLLGITRDPAVAGGGLLYGLDYNSGEVLFHKKLPSVPEFKWMEGTAKWDYQRDPDGNIYTFLGRVLVRIEPGNANVEPVGKLEQLGRMQFVGNDLYLTGTPHIRRIKAVTER